MSGNQLRGGPETCPRPCGVCEGDEHHWIDVCPDPDDPGDDDLQHEAFTKHELLAWFACKHCNAWVGDVDDDFLLEDE